MASEKLKKQTSDGRPGTSRADTQLDSQGGLPRDADANAAPARRWTSRSAWMARLLPSGIKERLFLLIVLALIPALLLQGWTYYAHCVARRNEAMQTELEVAQGVARTFTSYLNDIRRQLNTVGQAIITFDSYTDVQAEHLLGTVIDQYPAIRNVSWVSPHGLILASSQADLVGHNLSHRPYFQQVLEGQSWSLGDLMPRGSVTESPIFVIAKAIDDNQGVLRGAVVAAIEPTRLGEQLFTAERPAGGAYTIFDRQGRLVYRSPETPLTWEQRSHGRESDPLLQRALDNHAAQGSITSVIAGDRRIAARVPIPGIDWVVGASRPARIALGPMRLALIRETALGLLVTAFAFLIASLIARTIAGPLLRLQKEAEAMGEGRVGPSGDSDGPREVRRLRSTMTQMANDLIRRAESLRESEHRYRTLFTNMGEGFALGEAVFDENGAACDFRFLEINNAFEHETGLMREILGRPMTEVLPNLEQSWIDTYCGVALTGQPARFVNYNQDTGRHYDVFCYSPAPNRFAILFRDVTEQVQSEKAIRDANEQLQEQSERLQTQTEELRVINETLEQREREYRTLAENTPEVIARFDRRLRHTYINEYGAVVYGVPRQNVIGKTNADVGMPPDKVAFWNERFEQVFATGQQQTVDFEFDSPTFGHQYFSSLFVPEFDAYGRVASILTITRDVTETRLAQEELRRSEEELRRRVEEVETLMKVAPVAIWVSHDPQCNEIVGNRAADRFYEAHEEENVSANVSPVRRFFRNGKELKPEELPMQKAAARNIDIRNVELDVLLPSGRGLNMLGSASPLRDADGRVRGCVGAFMDITERKWTEEKLRRSEARLNRAQEIAHLGSWELDLITNELTWSDEVYRIFGCKPREFGATYEAFLERVHPDDRQAVDDAYAGSLREGTDTYEIEHRIIRKDTGEVRAVREKCEHFRDVTGRIIRSVGMVHDITERKQAEEALRSAALFPEENPSPVLRVARDGTLLYANASGARLLDMWNCRVGRTVPDGIRRHVELALDSGEATEVEVECDQIVYSFSIAPILSEGYVNLYGRDITERKRTEEAPRESRAKLEATPTASELRNSPKNDLPST